MGNPLSRKKSLTIQWETSLLQAKHAQGGEGTTKADDNSLLARFWELGQWIRGSPREACQKSNNGQP